MVGTKELQALLKKKYRLAVGERVAEELKMKINKALASEVRISRKVA